MVKGVEEGRGGGLFHDTCHRGTEAIYHTWYFLPAVLFFCHAKINVDTSRAIHAYQQHNSWMLSLYKFQFSRKSASLLRLTFIQLFMAQVPVQCYILLAFLSRLLCLASGKPYFISLLLTACYVTKASMFVNKANSRSCVYIAEPQGLSNCLWSFKL